MSGDSVVERDAPRARDPEGAGAWEWEEPSPGLLPWRRNVGAPVALDLAPPLPAPPATVDVLCWNVAIGRGDLEGVLRILPVLTGSGAPPGDARPLVILAQEVFRADESVPALAIGSHHGGGVGGGRRTDVVEFARRHGMSLRYAPSMRNGVARSDRGNAILSTHALGRTLAFSLPLLRQRRVAVAAELVGVGRLAFVSAHFENRTRLALGLRSWLGFGTSRAEQAEALGRRIIATEGGDVVLGADLNTPRGERDPAYLRLVRAGFHPAPKLGRWRHTHHGVVRLPLDHVMVHRGGGPLREIAVRRVDERGHDRGFRIFGSDHHPLLATVELDTSGADPAAA